MQEVRHAKHALYRYTLSSFNTAFLFLDDTIRYNVLNITSTPVHKNIAWEQGTSKLTVERERERERERVRVSGRLGGGEGEGDGVSCNTVVHNSTQPPLSQHTLKSR